MNKKKSKEIILEAATEIFHQKGFNGARMQEIADLAKVNKALLHYHFSSKEELFKKVFQLSFAELFMSFDSLLKMEISIQDKIDLLIDNYFDFVEENISNIKFIISSLDKNIEIVKENLQKNNAKLNFFDKIFAELQIKMDLGEMRNYNPRHLLVNIISMCIFPFLAKPMIKEVNSFSPQELAEFLSLRKEMVKDFVHRSLEKETK